MVVFGPHEHEEGAGAGGAVVPRGVSNNEEASSTVTSCVGMGGVWYVMIRRIGGACVCVFFWQFIGIMICTVLYTDYEGIDNYHTILCTSTSIIPA